MTNGEKLQETFPNMRITVCESYVQVMGKNYEFSNTYPLKWWNAEYQEPTDKIDCDNADCNNCVNHKYCDYESNKSEIPTGSTTKSETLVSLGVYKQVARERDIAIQQLHELGYEFGQKIEPTTKNDLGVDCISRKAVLDMAKSYNTDGWDSYTPLVVDVEDIEELPSITSIRPKGHWIKGYTFPDGEYWKCDKCNEMIKVKYPMHYCNNCGADMREVEE